MLKYTFTRREKALILVLAIILVAITWFVFVYQNTTNELSRIDSELSTVTSDIDIESARLAQMQNMQSTIEQRKAEGVEPTLMPTYDNMRQLMAELNGIMRASETYTLTFDDLNRENADYVERGVRIDYVTGTYKKAEAIVDALANGNYPCRIDSVAISDSNVTASLRAGAVRAGDAKAAASVHVTFFEEYPEGYQPPVEESEGK